MAVEVDEFGYFAYLWELTNYKLRPRVGMLDHTSWNTLLNVAKMTDRDFPETDED
jgi:hypothetical protein